MVLSKSHVMDPQVSSTYVANQSHFAKSRLAVNYSIVQDNEIYYVRYSHIVKQRLGALSITAFLHEFVVLESLEIA